MKTPREGTTDDGILRSCEECGRIHLCHGPRCEGCKKPATTTDSEGVPLCQECYDELAREARNAK